MAMVRRAVFLFFIVLSGSAVSAQDEINEKYQFDELKEVKHFSLRHTNSWYPVDRQSLIVRSTASKAYLLILDRELRSMRSSSTVHISSDGPRVFAKFDRIRPLGIGVFGTPVRIMKIYELRGKQQREQVVQAIRM